MTTCVSVCVRVCQTVYFISWAESTWLLCPAVCPPSYHEYLYLSVFERHVFGFQSLKQRRVKLTCVSARIGLICLDVVTQDQDCFSYKKQIWICMELETDKRQ